MAGNLSPRRPATAIAAGLAVGVAVGLVIGGANGIGVGMFKVNPLIITLGMSSILLSLFASRAQTVLQGRRTWPADPHHRLRDGVFG